MSGGSGKRKFAKSLKVRAGQYLVSGKVGPTGLPSSDVLYYELEGGAWVCVRPSGTEPKIKFYYGVKASSMDEAQVESAKFAEWAKAQA